jgi:Ca2+-binding EF-hand superfamily protein
MGGFHSKKVNEHSIMEKLRNATFQMPSERDYSFMSYLTDIEVDEIESIINKWVREHPDGLMNRRDFCFLYHTFRKDTPEVVQGLTENVFRALGVAGNDSDMITLKEFFLVYTLTSSGDLQKRLEYAFDLYDTNGNKWLDMNEAKDVLYGILELFPESPNASYMDMTKSCAKNMKTTEVVRKGLYFEKFDELTNEIFNDFKCFFIEDFIEAMISDKQVNRFIGHTVAEE